MVRKRTICSTKEAKIYERDTRCELRRKVSKLSRDSSRNTHGASTETEEKNQPTRGAISGTYVYIAG